jgi:general secretion pathway protein A
MDYFNILNLSKEPFSNSPDPEFFFNSRQHLDCLQKLELSLLLRRGLNVIVGDVGTGKTTMCRQIIRRFAQKNEIETHLILDPYFLNATEFLATVANIFLGKKPPTDSHEGQLKEIIKQYLFQKGVDQKRTTILIIDEGQKIPAFCLEILREFLNYETNEYKLLQIVIFAQREFDQTIRKYPNFADRINLYHLLKPLGFRDTRLMIKFRLEKSSNSPRRMNLFTYPALWSIYRISGGYPRKIINLCHQCILTMIIQNRSKIGCKLVRACSRRVFTEESRRWKKISATAALAGAAVAILLLLLPSDRLRSLQPWRIQPAETVMPIKNQPENDLSEVTVETPVAPAQIAPMDFYSRQARTDPALEADKGIAETEKAAEAAATVPAIALDTSSRADEVDLIVETRYAEILGTIALKRHETLSWIIQRVYGDFNSKYFKLLVSANPEIVDPDRVIVGQAISLPAIPVAVSATDKPQWWIRIDETDTLEAGLNLVRDNPDGSYPIRLIPYWSPTSGTRFAVVLKELFKDERSALEQLAQLPPGLSTSGMIFSFWNENYVYFADPFFGQTP